MLCSKQFKCWGKFLIGLVAFGGILLWWRLYRTPVRVTDYYMGTFFTITAYGPRAKSGVDAAMREIARIEALTTGSRGPEAELNNNTGRWMRVPGELYRLLQRVDTYRSATDGYFEPAIGSLVELWGFGYGGEGQLPTLYRIQEETARLSQPGLEFRKNSREVRLRPRTKLDLGGVAKGYAVDRAVEVLRQYGVRSALVNGGESSIRALGTRPGGAPWRIGLPHPRNKDWIGVFELPGGMAMGTSADTQRYFIRNGRRYSHLINPKTGYPPEDVYWVSVLAPSALQADVYSTAVFVCEGEDRLEVLRQWNVEGAVVPAKGDVQMTQEYRNCLRDK